MGGDWEEDGWKMGEMDGERQNLNIFSLKLPLHLSSRVMGCFFIGISERSI